jgi:hypothetical protein
MSEVLDAAGRSAIQSPANSRLSNRALLQHGSVQAILDDRLGAWPSGRSGLDLGEPLRQGPTPGHPFRALKCSTRSSTESRVPNVGNKFELRMNEVLRFFVSFES